MIFTGSREWGLGREGVEQRWLEHERSLARSVVAKLVATYVIGLEDEHKRDRKAVGVGLSVMQGGAAGLDMLIADKVRHAGMYLRRRTRTEFRGMWVEPELAEGLWLHEEKADWDNRPRHLAGPERNQRMLDLHHPDRVIAMFAYGRSYGATERGGTNDMVRRAVAAGVPLIDIYVCGNGWRKP